MKKYQYPFFHWVTGIFLWAFFAAGFFLGVLVKVAL